MTTSMIISLAIFVFMLVGFLFADKFHTTLGVVAFCTIALCAICGLVPANSIIANFGNSNVILVSTMFVVSAGFGRTQAVKKVSSLVYKVSGGNFKIMLAGYLVVTYLLAQFVGIPTAVFTLVAPLAAVSCAEFNVSPSKIMFPISLVSLGCTGVWPIGTGATTFSQMNGFLESFGYGEYVMGMLDPFKGRLIPSFIILLYAIFLAPKFAPDQPSVPIVSIEAKGANGKEVPPLDPVREVLGYVIFAFTALGLIFQNQLHVQGFVITLIGAALMVFTGVLSPKEATDAIPVRIALLIVAALSLGSVLVESGLGDVIGNALAKALGGTTNGYIIGGAFFIIPFVLTQFMSNMSVNNAFVPVLVLTCKALGCNPIGPMILLNAACLTAFMTPAATPSIPIVMGMGGYSQKDMFKMSALPALIIAVVSVGVVMTIFPAF